MHLLIGNGEAIIKHLIAFIRAPGFKVATVHQQRPNGSFILPKAGKNHIIVQGGDEAPPVQ